MIIDALNFPLYKDLNKTIRDSGDGIIQIDNCYGQRYIGCALGAKKQININGTPGNALGAYLDGAKIKVYGNAQDAAGDTMNDGSIIIHGSCGDAAGYGMRGGKIYIKGNAGYRAGIHMKAYKEKLPVMVIGGGAGSFLAEYQAGGIIIVLGIGVKEAAGYMCGTGMHGGKIFLRCETLPPDLPSQVIASEAKKEDLQEIMPYLTEFCGEFSFNIEEILSRKFYMLVPDTKNPYRQLYTHI